jgi:Icc-related predicted phosphoesterase
VLLSGCTSNRQKLDTPTSRPGNTPVVDIQINNPKPYPYRFVAYGDMRFAEHDHYGVPIANSKARQQVINQIAKEAPAFLVVTGDFVFRGFHAEDWTNFDQAIKPLRDAGVPLFPAIGNHEVGPFPAGLWGREALKEIESEGEQRVAARGLDNYFKDFPNISRKLWYSVRYANCYFLVLDSEANDDETAAQDQWIRTQLDAIPSDVDYVFVALHRPPYTALSDPVHKPRPAQVALSKLLEQRQQNNRVHFIVLAGHVHNYERYQHGDVMYVVSGGGGAALVKFPRSADDLYPQNPLFGKNDPLDEDQYHYCVLTVDHSKLNFQMMKLVDKGKNITFEARDSFSMDAAPH